MVKDYSKGKIYKIVCNITNKIYIGSTCEPTLARRLANHVQSFKKWKRDSVKYNNISSFQILEQGDYYIEILEICSCTINEELLARERYYIKSIECVNKYKNLNRTEEDKKEYTKEWYNKNIDKKKEWYNKNIDTIKEYNKEYYEKNKEKNYKITCECGSELSYSELPRHKKSLKHIAYEESLNINQPPLI